MTHEVAENTTGDILTFTVSDPDTSEPIAWSVEGPDGAYFTAAATGINDYTQGTVSVASGKMLDYETQTSYSITVKASDGTASDTVAVTVNVTNVDEAGTVSFDSTSPAVGAELIASLSDPDGGVTDMTWQWSSSATSDGTFTAISGTTDAAYTPVAGDEGNYLRATASYDDTFSETGDDKKTASATTSAVAARPDTAPSFGDKTVDALSYTVGDATTLTLPVATNGNGDLTYSLTPGLPAGLTFDAATRMLSGTPETSLAATSYSYIVTDADDNTEASDTDTLLFDITIAQAKPATPQAATVSLSFRQ